MINKIKSSQTQNINIRAGLLILSLLLISCERIDYTWHKYTNENSEVWGKQSDNVLVISHGWKIIENSKIENGDLKWGWEVTLKIKEPDDKKQFLIGIENIEYSLFDKDNFKLGSVTLNLDEYGRVVWDSGEQGPVLQKSGDTKTYRQTGELSESILKRAAFGRCRITI